MCLPLALGAANAGFNLWSAKRGSDAALQSGFYQMQSAMAAAQQNLLENQIAEANARMAMIEAGGRSAQVIDKTNAVIDRNRVDAAARGLAVDQGSPLLDAATIAAQGNVDRQLLMAGGLMEASNAYRRGAAASGQAIETIGAGREALNAARYGAGSAWLGGLQNSLRGFAGLNWQNAAASVPASGGGRISLDPSSWWSF